MILAGGQVDRHAQRPALAKTRLGEQLPRHGQPRRFIERCPHRHDWYAAGQRGWDQPGQPHDAHGVIARRQLAPVNRHRQRLPHLRIGQRAVARVGEIAVTAPALFDAQRRRPRCDLDGRKAVNAGAGDHIGTAGGKGGEGGARAGLGAEFDARGHGMGFRRLGDARQGDAGLAARFAIGAERWRHLARPGHGEFRLRQPVEQNRHRGIHADFDDAGCRCEHPEPGGGQRACGDRGGIIDDDQPLAHRRAIAARQRPPETGDDIGGEQRLAVAPFDRLQAQDQRAAAIDEAPARGEARHGAALAVATDQRRLRRFGDQLLRRQAGLLSGSDEDDAQVRAVLGGFARRQQHNGGETGQAQSRGLPHRGQLLDVQHRRTLALLPRAKPELPCRFRPAWLSRCT